MSAERTINLAGSFLASMREPAAAVEDVPGINLAGPFLRAMRDPEVDTQSDTESAINPAGVFLRAMSKQS